MVIQQSTGEAIIREGKPALKCGRDPAGQAHRIHCDFSGCVSLSPDIDLKWEVSLRKEVIKGRYRKFRLEYRNEAVKMVIEDLGVNLRNLRGVR